MQNIIIGICVESGSRSGKDHEMAVPDNARERHREPDSARQGLTEPDRSRESQAGPGSTSQQDSSTHRTLCCFKKNGS